MNDVELGLFCALFVFPVALYSAYRAGRQAAQESLNASLAFARDALETLKAGSLVEKAQAEGLRERDGIYREKLLDSFNAEIAKLKADKDEELEAFTLRGEKVSVRKGNLDPLSPLEMRDLEEIS